MTKKYKITVTEAQMRTMERALDLYARIGMGQLDEIVYVQSVFCNRDSREIDLAREIVSCAKQVLYPELSKGASYGIMAHEVSQEFKVAFDMRTGIKAILTRDHEAAKSGALIWGAHRMSDEHFPTIETVDE